MVIPGTVAYWRFDQGDRNGAPVELAPEKKCYDHGYGVIDPATASPTVAAKAWVGCGAYAIRDDVPERLWPVALRSLTAHVERIRELEGA